jgi:hypothetical protein
MSLPFPGPKVSVEHLAPSINDNLPTILPPFTPMPDNRG